MQVSRLESLPVELLEIVFNHLDDGKDETFEGLSHPISSVLRPYVQRIQYRFIDVDYSHFLLLCRTVKNTPHLAALIKGLLFDPARDREHKDYKIKDESLVFNFFKSVSLENLDGLEHHPFLQSRIVSAKYAIHCNQSLESLTLYFPSEDYGDVDPLCRHSRYLSYFPVLSELRVITSQVEWETFSGKELDKFEEEDRVEFERSGLGEYD